MNNYLSLYNAENYAFFALIAKLADRKFRPFYTGYEDGSLAYDSSIVQPPVASKRDFCSGVGEAVGVYRKF